MRIHKELSSLRRDDFCARIKITSYVLALQIFLFLGQVWIGLPNTISPISMKAGFIVRLKKRAGKGGQKITISGMVTGSVFQ
jgi:hypothetical protein